MLFLAYELGYWFNHWLSHKVPFLWEFHKVHHTAEVLTPLTNFRVHPIYALIFANILALSAAIANGFGHYLFGDTAYQYAFNDTNIILVLFIHAYVHLQHSHMWIAFTGALGRIFISPAHHQVHHSDNPKHYNTNFGSCLALWDWLFGTLYVPQKDARAAALRRRRPHRRAYREGARCCAPSPRPPAHLKPMLRTPRRAARAGRVGGRTQAGLTRGVTERLDLAQPFLRVSSLTASTMPWMVVRTGLMPVKCRILRLSSFSAWAPKYQR